MKKLVVGLGNPGNKYSGTRHNVGFAVLDHLLRNEPGVWKKSPYQAETREAAFHGTNVLLAKPTTFMNLSGEAVQSLMTVYRSAPESLLVIHDDLDLPVGALRLRRAGGSGGHHGLDSIMSLIGSDFCRLRLGIGKPAQRGEGERYVLEKFSDTDLPIIQEMTDRAAKAVECWLKDGLDVAMNAFNAHSTFDIRHSTLE